MPIDSATLEVLKGQRRRGNVREARTAQRAALIGMTMENSYGQFGEYVDGGWHARSQPFEHFIGPGTRCWSATDGTILYGGSRIVHIGLDGGSRFETPKSDSESFTDFVKTRFGFVAIGAAQRVFIAADGGWQLVAQRGQAVTPDVWFRAVPLPDGRFLAIGLNGLSVVSEGTIESWPYPRGQLQTNSEAIDVTPDGTVWFAGRFQAPATPTPKTWSLDTACADPPPLV